MSHFRSFYDRIKPMKYRDLKLSFSIAETQFDIISLCLGTLANPIPRHVHSKNSYELHYISRGYGTLIIDEKKFDIAPDCLFMTGPGVPHEQISVQNDPMKEYCIYLQVIPGKSNQKDELVRTFLDCNFWFGTADENIHQLMKQVFFELENRHSGYQLMLQSVLQQIILSVARLYKTNETINQPKQSSGMNISDQAYLIIEEAFLYDYRTITLDELSERVSLGKRQTERLLQKHYNKTFLQKKTEARMSAACQLLLETDKNIYEIAETLGYSSSEHFTNAFKHFYGVTPSRYKSPES